MHGLSSAQTRSPYAAAGLYILKSVQGATGYNRWLVDKARRFMGRRILEAGAGIGNLSTSLLDHERLILADFEPTYVAALRQRFAARDNVRVLELDLTERRHILRLAAEDLDTVFCSNVLEHLHADEAVLRSFHDVLVPGGQCIIVVPAGRWLYTGLDAALGHCRRYTRLELCRKMQAAGFDLVHSEKFNRLGSLAWFVSGHVLRRRTLGPRQMKWFDRLLPLMKCLDYVLPLPGMSLLVVGRKPTSGAQRVAA